jgi:hypothetical protein
MRRWRRWVLVTLLIWIGIVVWWATRPVTDAVPTGIVKGVETSQKVQCDSPLSGNTTSPDPLPKLHTPPGPWVRAYERTPCTMPIENDRMILWADIALVVVGVVILAKTWKPGVHSGASDDLAVA